MASYNIKILLLAAGQSSRMGKPKQLLAVGDKPLLALALDTAVSARVSGSYCVLGANMDKIKPVVETYPIEIIENKDWKKGLGESIAIGVKTIMQNSPESEGILILLADQPWVDGEYVDAMIDKFEERPDAIIASDYGNFYGVPALFPSAYFDKLIEVKGDTGAKELLNDPSIPVIGIESSKKLSDIDTPEDFDQFLKTQNL
ncbi:MAG: nucleotidyltransferase family protein [Leeuwenhoekiella sp.]